MPNDARLSREQSLTLPVNDLQPKGLMREADGQRKEEKKY